MSQSMLRAAALIAAGLASAQADDSSTLDPVLVTATRTEQALDATLAPAVVIDRATIERSLAADLGELLRFVGGLDVARNGGPGQLTSLFLRGAESNQVLVLVDGVEINPGTIGGPAIQNIPLAIVERVEIVKGPRSALYGSEAIGGVINVITRRSRGARLEAAAGAGSHGAEEARLGAGWRGADADASFDFEHRALDGFRVQDGAPKRGNDRDSVNAQAGWSGEAVGIRVRHFDARGTTEYLDFFASPVSQDFRTAASALEAATTGDGAWRQRLTVSRTVDEIVQNESADGVKSVRDVVDWQHDLALDGQTLSFGAYLADEDARGLSFGDAIDEVTRVKALYVQDQWSGGPHALVAAFRATDHEAFGRHDSWNLDYGYRAGEATRLTLAAGAAFRAPDATDLYSGFCGNPDLAPETSRSVEAGLRHRRGTRHTFSANLFETEIDDLIVAVFGGPPDFPCDLVNVDRARIRGLELGYALAAAAWRLNAQATLQDPENLSTGQALGRRAKRTLALGAQRTLGRLELGADLLATGERKDSDFSTSVNPGYALLNLTARLALGTQWAVRAQVENLFDKEYVTAAGFNEPGRSVALRVEWRSE